MVRLSVLLGVSDDEVAEVPALFWLFVADDSVREELLVSLFDGSFSGSVDELVFIKVEKSAFVVSEICLRAAWWS